MFTPIGISSRTTTITMLAAEMLVATPSALTRRLEDDPNAFAFVF